MLQLLLLVVVVGKSMSRLEGVLVHVAHGWRRAHLHEHVVACKQLPQKPRHSDPRPPPPPSVAAAAGGRKPQPAAASRPPPAGRRLCSLLMIRRVTNLHRMRSTLLHMHVVIVSIWFFTLVGMKNINKMATLRTWRQILPDDSEHPFYVAQTPRAAEPPGQILLALGQDPEISIGAGVYARWLIPALFAFGLLQCHFKFLQSQNIVFPQMLTTALTSLLHILLCWILISKLDFGTRGAALANSISYLLNLVLLVFYINLFPHCKATWTGLSKEAFNGILDFTRLAIPSALMICLESWSFELLLLLSGLLPNPKLEASVLSIRLPF